MSYGRYGTTYWLLRFGLGAVLLWAGIELWRQSGNGSVFAEAAGLLRMSGNGRNWAAVLILIVAGTLLLLNRWVKPAALTAAIYLTAVLVATGRNFNLVNTLGLFVIALALLFWPHRRHRTKWRKVWPFRRREAETFEN